MGKALEDRYRAADRLSRVVCDFVKTIEDYEVTYGVTGLIWEDLVPAVERYQEAYSKAQAQARS